MKKFFVLTLLILSCLNYNAFASDILVTSDEIKTLRSMLTDIETAVNDKNIDGIITHLHPKVNVVFANAEVADGVDNVRKFYERMLISKSAVLNNIKTKATIDNDAKFYGNTAIAYGNTYDDFEFANGSSVSVPSTWNATLYKEKGEWKVVSLQFTVNMLDNPFVNKVCNKCILNRIYKFFNGSLI